MVKLQECSTVGNRILLKFRLFLVISIDSIYYRYIRFIMWKIPKGVLFVANPIRVGVV
ncbi:uncharacterized protein METZ01_LOCUS210481, partial [marine metagenome]